MKGLLTFFLTFLFTISSGLSAIKVEDIKLGGMSESSGKIIIQLESYLEDTPDLLVKDKMIQVVLKGSVVWPKINKKVTIGNNQYDTTLMAYQYDKDSVRVRGHLPFSLKGKESQVSLSLKGKTLEIQFPRLVKRVAGINRAPALANPAHRKKLPVTVIAKKDSNSQKYDESYLDTLLKDKIKTSEEYNENKIEDRNNNFFSLKEIKEKESSDEVKRRFSVGQRKKESPALSSYLLKIVAFLGVVVAFFFGIMVLFRKGVIKKGKLGFLNSTNTVEVLNTTYIGPKRSMLLIRAHKQVFLVGSSESGLNLISEVEDTTGLLKEGEKVISGTNFDTSLGLVDADNTGLQLKENILESKEDNHMKLSSPKKLTDQIKSKVKSLKSLQ